MQATTAEIPLWEFDPSGAVIVHREADLWRRVPGSRAVQCELCFRRCRLGPDEAGPCGARVNVRGRMHIPSHGVLGCCVRQMNGYQASPFLTYKPGALVVFLGGLHCSSHCTFCMSTDMTWRPEAVPWGFGEWRPGWARGWYGRKALLHPAGAISAAVEWGCTQIEFGVNEPTVTWEYTYDVARLAKAAGLDVTLETNGLTTPEAIEQLAPFVDAVDVGVKGTLAPGFYEQWMRLPPGATQAVKASLLAWKRAGVHVIVGDLIAPPQMQSDAEAERAQRELYEWVAAELGPQTPLLVTPMAPPGPRQASSGFLVAPGQQDRYLHRCLTALARARGAGLLGLAKSNQTTVRCPACGAPILVITLPVENCDEERDGCAMPWKYCKWWSHAQYATDGRCDHCGASVPIVTLRPSELEQARRLVRALWPGAPMKGVL